MLQGEHSAILLTVIELPFIIKIFVLSIFEWPFYTGFTVHYFYPCYILKLASIKSAKLIWALAISMLKSNEAVCSVIFCNTLEVKIAKYVDLDQTASYGTV